MQHGPLLRAVTTSQGVSLGQRFRFRKSPLQGVELEAGKLVRELLKEFKQKIMRLKVKW